MGGGQINRVYGLLESDWSIQRGLELHSRHLGQYEMSTSLLKKALDKKIHLKDVEVADVLKELSATVSSYGEYTQSRLELLHA